MIGSGAIVLAAGDFGTLIFIIIVVVSFIAKQINAAAKKAQAKPPVPPKPRRPAPPAAQRPRDQADSLRNEVEEFLRRAKQQQPDRPAATTAAGEPARRQRRKQPPTPPTPPRTPLAPTVAAEATSVADRHLKLDDFASREAHLSAIGQESERIATHVHDVFDQSVVTRDAGDRADDAGTPQAAVPTVAEGLMALLRDPQSIRQAVVLGEIFNRREW